MNLSDVALTLYIVCPKCKQDIIYQLQNESFQCVGKIAVNDTDEINVWIEFTCPVCKHKEDIDII